MNIYKSFNIEESEKVSAGFLIIQSVFFGFYFGSMDIVSHTLFLEAYTQEDISRAYVISGIAGIVLTALYSFFQNKIRFSRFSSYNLLVVTIFVGLLRLCFEILPAKESAFILFVLFFPLFILTMLGFWGTVTRIYNLRQGKRLFGIIDSGLILGIIVSSFSIPFILTTQFAVVDLLYFGFIGTAIAFVIQLIISGKYLKEEKEIYNKDAEPIKKLNFASQLIKNKYIRIMSLFVVLSVVTGFFIQYLFLGVTKEKYPEEINFAQFFGGFMGLIMTVTLIVKTTVYSKLLKTYGLKVSLIISPVILLIFAVFAALTGKLFGFTAISGGFIFFFLAISLSKLLGKTLKDAIEVPAFKLLYQSLQADVRYNVQSKIDGTVNEISAVTAGIGLTIMGLVSMFKLLHYTYVLIFILLLWVYVSLQLYKAYKNALNKSLESVSGIASSEKDVKNIVSWFKDSYERFSIMQKIEGAELIGRIIPTSHDTINKLLTNDQNITNLSNEKLISLSEMTVKKLTINSNIASFSADEAEEMARSREINQRLLVVRAMENGNLQDVDILLKLLKDYHPEVKKQAIRAAKKNHNDNVLQILIDSLFIPEYSIEAFHSLLFIGIDSVKYLVLAFHKTGIDLETQLKIVRLFDKINCPETTNELRKLILHFDKQIVYRALRALRKRKFKIPTSSKYQYNQLIIKHSETISWNINAKYILDKSTSEKYNHLKEAIDNEQKNNFEMLFLFLSIAYDTRSVNHVKENLEKGSAESIGFALELLDLFIDEELKSVIIPILEDLPESEKIRLLQDEFPLKKYSTENLLTRIVNRDYQKITLWTKACAMQCIEEISEKGTRESLVSNLYNPNKIITELAYNKINSLFDEDDISQIIKREEKAGKHHQKNYETEILNRVLYLKQLPQLSEFSNNDLIQVALKAETITLNKSSIYPELYDVDVNFIIIETGNIRLRNNNDTIDLKPDKILDLGIFKLTEFSFDISEETKIYKIPKMVIDQLIFENEKIGRSFIAQEHIMENISQD